MVQSGNFSSTRRKPRLGTLVLVALFHVLLLYGLAKAFAPDFTGAVEDTVVSAFTVTVTTPEEPPPPEPEPDEGAQGAPGREAVPREVVAPEPPVVLRPDPQPAPRASSTGAANSSGAQESGGGTGAAGTGAGTGSGGSGSGQGGLVAVTDPVKISGDINSASDYPTPPGGREIRRGHSVTIVMTVGVDGRASDCRVVRPSPDPVADRITCKLAVERFRFRPATNARGDPVSATYGWRQRWF